MDGCPGATVIGRRAPRPAHVETWGKLAGGAGSWTEGLRTTSNGTTGRLSPNLAKHGVSFEEAARVFLDRQAISVFDEEHSEQEERWITVGMASFGRILVVVHTFEELDQSRLRLRLISARVATRHERRQYEEQP